MNRLEDIAGEDFIEIHRETIEDKKGPYLTTKYVLKQKDGGFYLLCYLSNQGNLAGIIYNTSKEGLPKTKKVLAGILSPEEYVREFDEKPSLVEEKRVTEFNPDYPGAPLQDDPRLNRLVSRSLERSNTELHPLSQEEHFIIVERKVSGNEVPGTTHSAFGQTQTIKKISPNQVCAQDISNKGPIIEVNSSGVDEY